MSEHVIEGTKENLDELLKNPVVLLNIGAPWCGWCRAITPKIGLIADEMKEHVTFIKLNMDEYPEIRDRYEFQTVPALFFIKNGKVIKHTGTIPEKEIIETLKGMAS